ncbi:hydroxyacylglutathione hydrolase [Nitrococcus mobilis]|uniref:Hydroxyacylglutathione hydrolase n=1 Tax=Nitrococcus mobilis Nb-231 TaxID=314278 RepID=A4BUS9_9GAMM|nr:hydroxyacylglutathione hydrolase [Nitrococcus mobilis]EAR20533.1 Metallo-beta-lactamase superfamily protein [Nitrococcus mobilis Nb-231]
MIDPAFPLRAFRDNYIWALHDAQKRRVCVVDPGDPDPVLRFLKQEKLELTGILATHHHADHVGGIARLVKEHPVPVYGPAKEQIPELTHPLGEGDKVRLEAQDLELEVLEVPGHTAGHIAYVGHQMLFCGDTLFAGGCGRIFEGTAEQMYASLCKLAELDNPTRVYCAHEYTQNNLRFAITVEPDNTAVWERYTHIRTMRANDEITLPSTIGIELETNPFLRPDIATVKRSAEQHSGRKLTSDVEVFAAVRAWKDDF